MDLHAAILRNRFGFVIFFTERKYVVRIEKFDT